MTELHQTFDWEGTSADPNDEQFGHVVEQTSLEDADDYRAVLVGEPYDGAVIGRPGAREGPAALRAELAGAKTHSFGRGSISARNTSGSGTVSGVADLGDVDVPEEKSVSEVQETIREVTEAIHASDAIPIFLGGDNSLTYPNVAPLLDDGVAVISLDAHLDCREVRGQPSSGTPYRQLFEAGLDTLAVVGARDFENSTTYAEYLDQQGGTVVTANDVGDDLEAAAERVLAAVSDATRVYVSLDLDVLDAAAAPGVSAPTPGGLSTRELYRLLDRFAAHDATAGFEVVECAPPLDSRELTARAGSRALAYVLASIHD